MPATGATQYVQGVAKYDPDMVEAGLVRPGRRRAIVVVGGAIVLVALVFLGKTAWEARPCSTYDAPAADYCLLERAAAKKDKDAEKAAAICREITDETLRAYCLDGRLPASPPTDDKPIPETFPEPVAKANAPDGPINNEPKINIEDSIDRAVTLARRDSEEAAALCRKLGPSSVEQAALCLSYVASTLAERSVSDGELFCHRQAHKAYQAGCYRAFIHRLGVRDAGAAYVICDLLTDEPVRATCFEGVGQAQAQTLGAEAGKKWCDNARPVDQPACRRGAEGKLSPLPSIEGESRPEPAPTTASKADALAFSLATSPATSPETPVDKGSLPVESIDVCLSLPTGPPRDRCLTEAVRHAKDTPPRELADWCNQVHAPVTRALCRQFARQAERRYTIRRLSRP
ncbi:hypothetical protein KDL45_02630 [bacterium]|nr:hypothetical protein [bacterium]